MESAIRSALNPLANDLDSDVFEFLNEAMVGADVESAVDILCSIVPGFQMLTAKARAAKGAAVLLCVSQQRSLTTCGDGRSEALLRNLATQVGAHVLASAQDTRYAGDATLPHVVPFPGDLGHVARSHLEVPSELAAHVASLRALLPDLTESQAVFALLRCSRSVDGAADLCLSTDVQALMDTEEEEEMEKVKLFARAGAAAAMDDARAEAESRKRTLQRYDEQEVKSKPHAPSLPREMMASQRKKGEKVLAYVEGQAVYVRPGEKFIATVEKETTTVGPTVGQAFASSVLKIKKKGQGGASPGFK